MLISLILQITVKYWWPRDNPEHFFVARPKLLEVKLVRKPNIL